MDEEDDVRRKSAHVHVVLYSAAECASRVAICPFPAPERGVRS